ncbi:hypothetical protein [Streptomyces chrestomyceticus]|uniref:hypothetical protein n=1 Tax=Streptomyces chrestomyceticus TaxID=68185 RepID=UPI00379DC00A
MPVETQWNEWPLVTVAVRSEPAHEAREAILAMLRAALEREQGFTAVVDMAQLTPEGPEEAGRNDGAVADQARAVKELRPGLARNCRGLAFVVPPAGPEGTGRRDASDRFWGCPVTTVEEVDAAAHWARERLASHFGGGS